MKYGVGFCIVRGDYGIQIYLPNSADTNMYVRQRWNGAWSDTAWKRIAYTAVG